MPATTLVYALLMILLGVGTFVAALSGASAGGSTTVPATVATRVTALIPAFAALPFVLFALLSMAKPGLRKHLMHAAAGLALFLALSGLGMAVPKLIGAGFSPANLARPMATFAQLIMGLLSAGYLVLCVRSFIAARKARTGFAV